MRVRHLALLGTLLAGCTPSASLPQATPSPPVPQASLADSPNRLPMVELGFRLWFEPRLSANNQLSCATCHHHRKGFSNAEPTAKGVNGQRGKRNPPTIYGVAQQTHQFWDGRAKSLEEQALGPITDPTEMASRMEDVLAKLSAMPYYRQKFQAVFGTAPTADGIAKALSTFERALTVGPSPYDRFLAGDTTALSAQQQRGLSLFNSRKASCSACHNGKLLSNGMFVKTGVNASGSAADTGRFAVTGREQDRGAFKTPTLLNIAQSAPYMHDGSLPTLEAVVDFYNRGGDPAPTVHPYIRPLELTTREKQDLVAFMHALSGPDNLKDLAKLPGIRLESEKREDLAIPPDLLP